MPTAAISIDTPTIIDKQHTKLLLFLFYYLALGPVSLTVRLFQRDPLEKTIQEGSLYRAAEAATQDAERARRQF